VRPLAFFATLLTAGCAAREPLEDPSIKRTPPSLIADEGAALYVLEGPAGWLAQDLKFTEPTLDDQQLATALRYGLAHRQVRFIGHADFQPTHGMVGRRRRRSSIRTPRGTVLETIPWDSRSP
jgi:hypothetical protein